MRKLAISLCFIVFLGGCPSDRTAEKVAAQRVVSEKLKEHEACELKSQQEYQNQVRECEERSHHALLERLKGNPKDLFQGDTKDVDDDCLNQAGKNRKRGIDVCSQILYEIVKFINDL